MDGGAAGGAVVGGRHGNCDGGMFILWISLSVFQRFVNTRFFLMIERLVIDIFDIFFSLFERFVKGSCFYKRGLSEIDMGRNFSMYESAKSPSNISPNPSIVIHNISDP